MMMKKKPKKRRGKITQKNIKETKKKAIYRSKRHYHPNNKTVL